MLLSRCGIIDFSIPVTRHQRIDSFTAGEVLRFVIEPKNSFSQLVEMHAIERIVCASIFLDQKPNTVATLIFSGFFSRLDSALYCAIVCSSTAIATRRLLLHTTTICRLRCFRCHAKRERVVLRSIRSSVCFKNKRIKIQ